MAKNKNIQDIRRKTYSDLKQLSGSGSDIMNVREGSKPVIDLDAATRAEKDSSINTVKEYVSKKTGNEKLLPPDFNMSKMSLLTIGLLLMVASIGLICYFIVDGFSYGYYCLLKGLWYYTLLGWLVMLAPVILALLGGIMYGHSFRTQNARVEAYKRTLAR